ncbi:hypothetical protein ATANTOWER_013024 [Ataeniobius toweri]|uniref:Uncharacterized protein n=1 Tax=Ataeniobius toweri TaxID=208326 RepID=A0ABU7ANX9_9TELE|nr:hypothetical protein [Ataeniobius toweri]
MVESVIILGQKSNKTGSGSTQKSRHQPEKSPDTTNKSSTSLHIQVKLNSVHDFTSQGNSGVETLHVKEPPCPEPDKDRNIHSVKMLNETRIPYCPTAACPTRSPTCLKPRPQILLQI